MTAMRKITEADVLPLAEYTKVRAERRRAVTQMKKNRRVEVGPFATFYFESYDTMLHQVQEMLYIEKGGAEQIPDELAAYNPLIPNGHELTATVMLEIDEPVRRARVLSTLGGIEHTMFLRLGGETIKGVAEEDQERTNEEGKASSVHFVHFAFTPAQVAAFRQDGAEVAVGFSHANYGHLAILPETMRAALAQDFDA
jgi:hypothetical protein